MKCDVILAGVGGQGVLSVSAIIAASALKDGLVVKQSEVHGMSQRGGAVLTNLRISDTVIHSDIIPRGTADLILSMEPLESLRYLSWLSPGGTVITSTEPVTNIPDYPELSEILAQVRALPHAILVDAPELARQTATVRSANVVMVGAAAGLLPIEPGKIEMYIRDRFMRMGEDVAEANVRAFRLGRETVH
jgi:indolepyruvate ferredoxin oxidoreductase beta subunit